MSLSQLQCLSGSLSSDVERETEPTHEQERLANMHTETVPVNCGTSNILIDTHCCIVVVSKLVCYEHSESDGSATKNVARGVCVRVH